VIEWIEVLEILAVVMAAMGCVLVFAVLVGFARRLFSQEKTTKIEVIEPKKEKKPMSKEAREGVTFNDIFNFDSYIRWTSSTYY